MRKWLIEMALFLPLPFLLITDIHGKGVKMNWARIIEAIVMAIIVGLLTSYITVKELTIKVDALNYRLNRIENYIIYNTPVKIGKENEKQ